MKQEQQLHRQSQLVSADASDDEAAIRALQDRFAAASMPGTWMRS